MFNLYHFSLPWNPSCRKLRRSSSYILSFCSVEFDSIEMASSSTPWEKQTQPENAFEEIAPYSAPTSTEPWDIYINHRGPDVKHTFAALIYNTLDSMGFRVFLDTQSLMLGDSIPAVIQHAITTATLNIAIFSPHYAESPWLLAELSFMLKTGAKIIPIFYHVEPYDLRWVGAGKGMYASAFSQHEMKGRYTAETLDMWKKALVSSSFLSGYMINVNEDEATVLKKIVNSALKVRKMVPLWVCEHPVGLNELVQAFQSVASEEKVKITGIVGMGGSGKTVLVKELYNRNFSSFERCSVVFDVRDAASRNALPEKQKKLLADLGVHHLSFDTVHEGKAILANRLSSVRALIVLDDVDHIDQLNALLPNKDNLGSQSMVIVTTRDSGVLNSWGPSRIYKMQGLNRSHAEQLFCWHAFLQPSPPARFETLVQKFIHVCDGLPLSLKVLGAQLYGNDHIAYWEAQLKRVRILPGDIKQRLQVSYDALDDEEREMFLDASCFLIGKRESTAIAVWDGSGWSGLHGIETLVNKCLVELVDDPDYDGQKIIWISNQLRDLGREIAGRHSPNRIWFPGQIMQIINSMEHSSKPKLIRGIQPANTFVASKEYMHQLMGISSKRSKRLKSSNGLQILSVEGNEFTEEFASLSEDLVWLRWEGFPRRDLPSWLTSRSLSVLELHGANELEVLWQDNAEPRQLRELIISGNEKLQRLPSSIGCLQCLKTLEFSFQGTTLPLEFCDLQSLGHLTLSSIVLSSLPAGFGNLISLWNLNLGYCTQLTVLPDSFSQLIHLEVLDLSGCEMLSSLPAGFGNLISLRILNLGYCRQLNMLPDSFSKLIKLEKLNLLSCAMLSSLPVDFGNIISLRNLNVKYCKQLSMLPASFSQLVHLEKLNLSGCEMLSSLPADFGNLIRLRNLNLRYCRKLSMLPDSISRLIHLEKLNLSGCERLSSLPVGFSNLISLGNLNVKYCKQLSMLNLGNSTSLESIYLELSTLPADSKQSLQASFHELDDEETEMFLDVACFLDGEKESRAIAVWDGSGWSGLHGLETLVDKCIVELVDNPDYYGEKIIRMHDDVRDMGREIARKHSPYRIWFPGQIIDSKQHSTERKLIRAILPPEAFVAFKEYMHQSIGGSSTRSQHLRFPTGLQILSVEGNEFTEEFASLSKDLVWLRWEGFPLRNLPSWLQLRNLSVLELHGANEMDELWEDQEHAPLQLRELIITGTWSASFESFPSSISYLKILKKIALLGDVGKEFGIKELPKEFCDLESLEHLELRHCTLLSSLPARFGDLRNLRHLDLCSCKALRMLPVSFQQLKLLNYLDLSGCKRLLLQKDILENINRLKYLYLSGCLALQKIPHHITDQAYLRELQLQHTHLEDLPSNIGQLKKLEVLTIGSPLLKSLPDSLGNLSSLKSLSITDCFALECLPNTFGNLVLLEHLCIEATGVMSLPEGFRQLANLRTLKISDCPLKELDFGSVSSYSLEKLTEINLSETLVTRISISEHCCPRLETLQLSKNDYLEVVETLPATVNNRKLSKCEKLDMKGIRALGIPLKLTISDCSKELEKP